MNSTRINHFNNSVGLRLGSRLQFIPDKGVDFENFLDEGVRLLESDGRRDIGSMIPELRAKIATLRDKHPLLARRLEFLETVLVVGMEPLLERADNEIHFALLYAIAEVDLVPDVFPDVGYVDDAIICELVLTRHAAFFERFCAARGMDWSALRPAPGRGR
ncbi:MAG TPA: YkvA family protein [Chthoniobacter sp.]|nr:YkvA family protein [Chthoniobacter sp.]